MARRGHAGLLRQAAAFGLTHVIIVSGQCQTDLPRAGFPLAKSTSIISRSEHGFLFHLREWRRCVGAGVDDVPGGRKGEPAVDAKGNPAGLVTQLDTHFLLWRHDGRIKDVNGAVGAVVEPQFLFVGSKSDAMAGATVPLGGTFLKARHFNAVQHFSGLLSPTSKPNVVDVDETKGLAAIDGEGANGITERADLVDNRVGFGVHHGKKGRPQAGEIDAGAVGDINGIVRAGAESDFCDDIAGAGVHN